MAKQESGKPYSHFVTRFRLSGDIERAKLLVKTGERQMGILRKQLRFHDLFQGYREHEPFTGAMIRCSIVGSVRLIEIYVQPILPVEEEVPEERPCFCNCCMAECQIVKVDGTWRDWRHYDIPRPALGYQYGDRRLRYDIDVCSFLGVSPESGLLTYEFYRVENVMPSDFTPYEVGDWAMVYFTDLVRETECGKCEDCDPPLTDELGRVWGCLPRDVTLYINQPQCIILPIAIDDRPSRDTVYFRPLESMRLGTCIKKAVIDWVQYSKLDAEGKPVDGYANIRWDAWPDQPGGTVVDNIPIRYCTQDFTNQDGSHAYRWGNSVYLFMEGDKWVIIGRYIAELPKYQNQYALATMINPALIAITLWEERMYTESPDPEVPPDTRAMIFDFTHDTVLNFKRYSWSDDEYNGVLTPESAMMLLYDYFRRGPGDAINPGSYQYGFPSITYEAIQKTTLGSGVAERGICGSHTHRIEHDMGETGYTYSGRFYGGVTTQNRYDGPQKTHSYYMVGSSSSGPYYTITLSIPNDENWTIGEFTLSGLTLWDWGGPNLNGPWAWGRLKHTGGVAYINFDPYMRSYHLVEIMFAFPYPGTLISANGFSSAFEQQWNGLIGCATCTETIDAAQSIWSISMTGTWEYQDLFAGRISDRTNLLNWSGSVAYKYSGYSEWLEGAFTVGMGCPGFVYIGTSSVMLKIFEARYDVFTSEMSRGHAKNERVGQTQRAVRVELGGVRSRSDDPFTDGLGTTAYDLWDKPNIYGGMVAFVETIPILWDSYRDQFLQVDIPLDENWEWVTIETFGLHARGLKLAFSYLAAGYSVEHQLRSSIL